MCKCGKPKKSKKAGKCADCCTEYMRRWRNENKERCREYSRKKRLANPDRCARAVRDATLFRKYGLRIAEFDKLLEEQHGQCAVCGSSDPRGSGTFNVDHDHVTGQVRGLLCWPCNVALGQLGESLETVMSLAGYLIQSEDRSVVQT